MRITRRLPFLLVTLLALLVSIEATTPSRPATAQSALPTPTSNLPWKPCDGSVECARLSVPLDYTKPDGARIDLALVRAPARKPAERIGVLLANPGGPGASGNDFVRNWSRILDGTIRDRFDIVGFDPRGVGDSTPLECHDNIEELLAVDPVPETADEWAEARRVTQQFVDLCAQRGGDMLNHLGSLDVTRDMDQIRIALGEDKISYLGYSYGTVLGSLYADVFPDRVRAIVLDGPVDSSLAPDDFNLSQAVGFERALDHYAEDCRERPCDLARNGRDPLAAIDGLFAKVREAPIPSANADRPAGPGEALTGVVSGLYRREYWPSLTRAVQAALDGDGSWLVQMTDGLWGRRGDEFDNSLEMNSAVNCVDYPYSRDPKHYEDLTRLAPSVAPRFGAALGSSGLICALWPAMQQPLPRLDAADAPPLLIVTTTGDPATPYEWALGLHRDLASSVLLTFEGEGHTAYASGNRCVDAIVNAYLLTLATPEDGTTCGADLVARPPATPVVVPTRAPGPQLTAPASPSATPTSTAATEGGPAGAASDADSTEPLLWGSVAVLVLIVVVGVVLVARSRRRRRA